MAERLTTHEVHMKSFTATKFREGYDQDEVDDFLDQVILTIAEFQKENTELKEQLEVTQNRLATYEAGQTPEPLAPVAADNSEEVANLHAELEAARAEIAALHQAREQAAVEHGVVEAPVVDDSEVQALRAELGNAQARIAELEQGAGVVETDYNDETDQANSIVVVAQRVHDEYVREGKAESTRLITEARAQGQQIVREAEERRDSVISEMEQHKSNLERQVEELRAFEQDYRAQLRGQLENLLNQVSGQ